MLPFDNLSTDPEVQFFSDGVSEEIIQRLSRGAELKVIGRTSSFQFRGDSKAHASQTTLWSERYDLYLRARLRGSLGPLDTMSANSVALARMAAGRVEDAVPVFEDLVARNPDMSFPVSSLLRAKAFLADWDGVDELLQLAAKRQLRESSRGRHSSAPGANPRPRTSADGVRASKPMSVPQAVLMSRVSSIRRIWASSSTGPGPANGRIVSTRCLMTSGPSAPKWARCRERNSTSDPQWRPWQKPVPVR